MNKKVLIVDGPDCTGKSTLCKKLQEAYGLPVFHLSWFSDESAMSAQFEMALRLIQAGGVIVDRYIFSNIAYGNVYHGGRYVANWEKFLESLSARNIENLISLPKDRERYLEFYCERLPERNEMYDGIPDRVYDEYAALLERYGDVLNMRRYDLFDAMENKPSCYEAKFEDGLFCFSNGGK